MKELVEQHLKQFEEKFGFEILFAVESGSRMWGFESDDSDFDVRFVYRYPTDKYLHIAPPMQNIDKMAYPGGRFAAFWDDPMDYAGWDVRKTFDLALRGNAVISEWVRSPIVYRDHPLRNWLHGFLNANLPQERYFMHYLGMSGADLNRIADDGTAKPVKKALYALRCLLSAHHVYQQRTLPPLNLAHLCASFISLSGAPAPGRMAICEAYDELRDAKKVTEDATSPVVEKHMPMLLALRDLLNTIRIDVRSEEAYAEHQHILNSKLALVIQE